MPEITCERCQRVLTSPRSIKAGAGRGCLARRREEALRKAIAGFSAEQRERAVLLISDAGVVPTRQPGVWRTVSTDGSVIYLTTSQVCSCPAGQHDVLCYHVAAVRVMEAANRKAAA